MKDLYVVPFDFTPITEGALNYALRLSEEQQDDIVLVHIAKNSSKEEKAEQQFNDVLKNIPENASGRVSSKVVVGHLIDDIGKVAQTLNASTIVMGTHGAHGLQKILGSNALKVVSHSEVPFVITQDPAKFSKISKIVMPFSYAKETIQVVQAATTLAKKYKASIDLIGYRSSDEWLIKDMKVNQRIMSQALADNGVDHQIVSLPGKRRYETELLEYAKENEADLIAAAYFHESIFSVVSGSFLQDLITNPYNIPVLTVNAETLGKIHASIVY